jgi:hypothetical protein
MEAYGQETTEEGVQNMMIVRPLRTDDPFEV